MEATSINLGNTQNVPTFAELKKIGEKVIYKVRIGLLPVGMIMATAVEESMVLGLLTLACFAIGGSALWEKGGEK